MAISVAWQTVVTFSAATTPAYTVPTSATVLFGAYARDLVINNSGTVGVFANLNPAANAATTTASFLIPAGGTVILTQCQVPGGSNVNLIPQSGTASASIGWATNVAYI